MRFLKSRIARRALLLGGICLTVLASGETPAAPDPAATELDAFILEAENQSPGILEARWKVEQALIRHQELLEFLDPQLVAAAGYADHAKSVPGSTTYDSTTNNAAEFRAGVEIPFEQGFYLAIGGAERLFQDGGDHGHYNQTLVGARLRIPLLKDRGFALLGLDRALARAEYNAAVSALLRQTQLVRRDVTLAYIAAYESQMSYKVTVEASERFRKLVGEATELERLGVIPAYQIHDTRMDLQIGLENEEIARNKVELSLISLATTLGNCRPIRLRHENDEEFIVGLASGVTPVTTVDLDRALQARGSYQAIENTVEQARVRILAAEEEMKDDLSLNVGVAWQAEDEHRPLGFHELSGDEREGAEVALVWKRSLDQRGPRARKARYAAQVEQYRQQLRAEAVAIEAEIRNALNNLTAAKARLDIVRLGIEAAEKTLEAELERFKLGQTTSSVVTDAQKDLTSLKQRRTAAAADFLRAWANLRYASGYTLR